MKPLRDTFAAASIVSAVAGCSPSLSPKPFDDIAQFRAYVESHPDPCNELTFSVHKKFAILKKEIDDPATGLDAQMICADPINNDTPRGEVSAADLCSLTDSIRKELDVLEGKVYGPSHDDYIYFDNNSAPSRYEYLLLQQKKIHETIAQGLVMTRKHYRKIIAELIDSQHRAAQNQRKWCKD